MIRRRQPKGGGKDGGRRGYHSGLWQTERVLTFTCKIRPDYEVIVNMAKKSKHHVNQQLKLLHVGNARMHPFSGINAHSPTNNVNHLPLSQVHTFTTPPSPPPPTTIIPHGVTRLLPRWPGECSTPQLQHSRSLHHIPINIHMTNCVVPNNAGFLK